MISSRNTTDEQLKELIPRKVWDSLCEKNLDETENIHLNLSTYTGLVNGVAYCIFHKRKHGLCRILKHQKDLTADDIYQRIKRFREAYSDFDREAKTNRIELRTEAEQHIKEAIKKYKIEKLKLEKTGHYTKKFLNE